MTEAEAIETTLTEPKKRGRGAAKTFPLSSFEDVLRLARTIHQHGIDGQLRRLTVFDRLHRSPESSLSRQLVTDSARYGLTTGSYGAEYLTLTAEGTRVVDPDTVSQDRRTMEFELGVKRIEAFNSLYERLRGKRLPEPDVLKDQATNVAQRDREQCVNTFMANVRYLGLIREQAGSDRIVSIDEAIEELPEPAPGHEVDRRRAKSSEERQDTPPPTLIEPTVHIDVNIHIDSSASPEQIDQIFASMGRHLYGREAQA